MEMRNKAVIVDTYHSPYAHLKPVPLNNISLDEGFWRSRYVLNQRVTIPSQFQLLEKTGRLDNFRRVSGESNKPYQGLVFNDSDVYKWLEAASWAMVLQQDDALRNLLDQIIPLIIKAQDKDGYLNTYFSLERVRERWMNLQDKHELYCAGHLIQAAIAHYRVTREERLMNVAIRLADHICKTFGPSQVEGTSGHPEIEMALVELYRTTGDEIYLKQAGVFVDRRGRGLLGNREYLLDHLPIRKMEHLAGHAVRAVYLCSGITDVALETGEQELVETLERLWTNMVGQQMYLTGGIGARHEGEAFGQPYELPNSRAYAETCAAIANVMWNWRLLHLDGGARYADLMEWSLYNAVLPGISLDGSEYFYVNPLKSDGSHRRENWFECACCPPNIARTLSALPGYMYGVSKGGLWLHLYAPSTATIELLTGQQITLEQTTAYPWDGHVRVKIVDLSISGTSAEEMTDQKKFSLYMRLPGWLADQKVVVRINDKTYRNDATSGTYLEILHEWKKGDVVDLIMPMEVRFVSSHPMVEENLGRVAITRGPIVYCLETVDNPNINLYEVSISPSLPVDSEYLTEMLGGITRLHLHGFTRKIDPTCENHPYRQVRSLKPNGKKNKVDLVSIPYFAWANREPGAMEIWHLVR